MRPVSPPAMMALMASGCFSGATKVKLTVSDVILPSALTYAQTVMESSTVVTSIGLSYSVKAFVVSVVLKLKAKTVTDRIDYIGDDKTTAYDDEGNVYRIDNTAYSIKVAEGISVKADLGSYGLHFLNVPKKTEKLQLVKLFLYNDFEDGNGACRGYIELRDVPIAWRE